jgi:hypothetical protein
VSVETPLEAIERDRRGNPLPPPGTRPTSLKWAMIVPLCAVGMLVLFIGINSIDSPGRPPATTIPALSSTLGLTVSPVNPFEPLIVSGEPPPDVLNSVVLPSPSTQVASLPTGASPSSFDASFLYSSTSSQGALYSFFHTEMAGHGWRIFSVGTPVNQKGIEILAQKSGTDGWFWEEGVIIHPTKFSPSSTQSTRFTIRLYQASQDS